MKFKDKSPGMQGTLDKMSKAIVGRGIIDCLDQHICVACGTDTKQLEGIELQEYELSGMCPDCFKSYGC